MVVPRSGDMHVPNVTGVAEPQAMVGAAKRTSHLAGDEGLGNFGFLIHKSQRRSGFGQAEALWEDCSFTLTVI
jgi:hypothetical protein